MRRCVYALGQAVGHRAFRSGPVVVANLGHSLHRTPLVGHQGRRRERSPGAFIERARWEASHR